MEYSQDILTNDPEGTVNKLHRRRYVQKVRSDFTMAYPTQTWRVQQCL